LSVIVQKRLDKRITAANGGVPIPHWVIHDLRRTLATGMARLKIASETVADKIIGTRTLKGVAGIYQRYEFEEEKRAALVESISPASRRLAEQAGLASNVVSLRRHDHVVRRRLEEHQGAEGAEAARWCAT
jgi:hypothetical protein